MKNLSRYFFVFVLLVFAARPSWAMTVFDPTNFSKNLVTAAESVKHTAIEASQEQTLINQYMLQLQNVQQLDPQIINYGISRGIIPAGVNYGSVQQVIEAAKGTYGSIGGINQAMSGMDSVYQQLGQLNTNIQRTSIYSQSTPEQVIQYEFQRSQAGESSTDNYYNSIRYLNDQLNSYQQRSDALAKSIPNQNGILQMLQVMATQNTLTQDMLAHLIQVTSSETLNQMEARKNQYQDLQNIQKRRNAGNEVETSLTNNMHQSNPQ